MKTPRVILFMSMLVAVGMLLPKVQGQLFERVSIGIARTNDQVRINCRYSSGRPLETNRCEIQFTDSLSLTNWRALDSFVFTNYAPVAVFDTTTNSPPTDLSTAPSAMRYFCVEIEMRPISRGRVPCVRDRRQRPCSSISALPPSAPSGSSRSPA